MRLQRNILMLLGVGVLLCGVLGCGLAGAGVAAAEPTTGSKADIGTLTSRYSTLNDLANTQNPDENVVIDTRIDVLVGANQALDGSQVRFEGEAVGEPVDAGGGRKWVSFNNASGDAVSVLMSDDLAAKIQHYGDHQEEGAEAIVTGTYHVACSDHQGELEVHADGLTITDEGEALTYQVDHNLLSTAIMMLVMGCLFLLTFVLLRRRSDEKAGIDSKGKRAKKAHAKGRGARGKSGRGGGRGRA